MDRSDLERRVDPAVGAVADTVNPVAEPVAGEAVSPVVAAPVVEAAEPVLSPVVGTAAPVADPPAAPAETVLDPAVTASPVAGVVPAWRMGRVSPGEALREE